MYMLKVSPTMGNGLYSQVDLYLEVDQVSNLVKVLCPLVKHKLLFIGNIVVLCSYCSAATWENERITVMSFLTAMQALGFILGPGTQSTITCNFLIFPLVSIRFIISTTW